MFLNKKMKKKNKEKIRYHEPPMKYNIALHKFEPALPQKESENTEPISDKKITLIIVIIIIFLIILFYVFKLLNWIRYL